MKVVQYQDGHELNLAQTRDECGGVFCNQASLAKIRPILQITK